MVSGQGKSRACFVTLAERKKRFYIAVKMSGYRAETMAFSIVYALRFRVIASRFVVIIAAARKRVMLSAVLMLLEYPELYVMRIRKLCRKRGLVINKLAVMSDVKQSTLDNIVRGLTKNPRVKTLPAEPDWLSLFILS